MMFDVLIQIRRAYIQIPTTFWYTYPEINIINGYEYLNDS